MLMIMKGTMLLGT